GHPYTPFNTYEVCVYDGNRLVAASLYDLGECAMASLIAMQDPEYQKHSLGIYTMLKEVEHARKMNLKWYYPGYVLDKPSSFSYKLSLGTFEHYNVNRRWVAYSKFKTHESLAERYKKHLSRIEDGLRHHSVEFDSWLYPYFSMGYMNYWSVNFVRAPKFLEIPIGEQSRLLVVYNLEEQEYQLLWATNSKSKDHLLSMELSDEFQNDEYYCLDLLETDDVILSSENPQEIIDEVSILSSSPHSSRRRHLK
ncbi:MAG: hypothetical protein HKN32_04480, partial [Flavobacteriales bacterium]|nr:hypothetical protein [Flavobacteriales bacterium]